MGFRPGSITFSKIAAPPLSCFTCHWISFDDLQGRQTQREGNGIAHAARRRLQMGIGHAATQRCLTLNQGTTLVTAKTKSPWSKLISQPFKRQMAFRNNPWISARSSAASMLEEAALSWIAALFVMNMQDQAPDTRLACQKNY